MKVGYHLIYVSIIILLIIAYFIYLKKSSKELINPIITEKVIRDTVIRVETKEPIFITQVKPKLIYKYDTIYTSPPFIAEIDTVIKTDTIYMSYEFPENLFNLTIKYPLDSLILREITFTKTIQKEKEWWEIPLYIASGATLGFLIGMSINFGSNK